MGLPCRLEQGRCGGGGGAGRCPAPPSRGGWWGKVSMETAAPASPEIWGKTGFKKSPSSFQAGRAAWLHGEERSLRVTGPWKKSQVPPRGPLPPHQCPKPPPVPGSLCISFCAREKPAFFLTYCSVSSHRPSIPPLSPKCSSVPPALKAPATPSPIL